MDLTELEILRRECGWSKAELAAILDLEDRTVARWIRGEKGPAERNISDYTKRLAEASANAGIPQEKWRAALYSLKDQRRPRKERAPNAAEHPKPLQANSSAIESTNPSGKVEASPAPAPSVAGGVSSTSRQTTVDDLPFTRRDFSELSNKLIALMDAQTERLHLRREKAPKEVSFLGDGRPPLSARLEPPFMRREFSRADRLKLARVWLHALQEAQPDVTALARKEIRHRAGQPRLGNDDMPPGSAYFTTREQAVDCLLAAGLPMGAKALQCLTQPIMGVLSDPAAALAAICKERDLLVSLDTQTSNLFLDLTQKELDCGD